MRDKILGKYFLFFVLLGILTISYPYILFFKLDYQSILKNKKIYEYESWNIMLIWLFYIIPIINFVLCLKKLIDGSYKLFYINKLKEIPILLIKLYLGILFSVFFLFFNGLGCDENDEEYLKKFISRCNKVIYITFSLSIFLLYDRFIDYTYINNKVILVNNNQVLSGDLLFLIIPFILSSLYIFNNPFKKSQNIDE